MKKLSLGALAVISSCIFLSSCLKNTNSTTQPTLGAFLLAQTSPNAPTLSVYVNSSLFDTLQFSNYTPYVTANPGSYELMIDSFPSTTALIKNTINIEANKSYSYFIIDSFSKIKTAFVNDVYKAPSSDSVYVRFFNFCPNTTEPLNLVDSATSGSFSSLRTFNDQANNPQYTAFNEVKAGTFTFQLKTASGTTLKTQSIPLTGGHVYTLFAKGTIGNPDPNRALSIGQLENYPQQ